MTYGIADFSLKKIINKVDWKLLLFLLLFLNVKIAVKITALIIIYLLRFNFKFGLSIKNSRLPLCYLLMIMIAVADLFVNNAYANPYYLLVFFNGVVFWLLCLLAMHQVKLSVENNTAGVMRQTILVFFVINAVISFYNIGQIMWESGMINPYRYQGEHQKYFISTGDYIKGLTFDTSTTNAVINAFGVIYFLNRKSPIMLLTCMAVLLLTGSNFINIALLLILTGLFILKSSKDQKSLIVACLMLLVVFMSQVSPQNNRYVLETFRQIIHPPRMLTGKQVVVIPVKNNNDPETIRRKIANNYLDSVYNSSHRHVSHLVSLIPKTEQGRIIIVPPDINKLPYQKATDTTPDRRRLLAFIGKYKNRLLLTGRPVFSIDLPGKALGMLQTVNFLKAHPAKIIAGDGMGNFSSKLAFKATGLGFAGGYPSHLAYISNEFFFNHLDIYLNFFSRDRWTHSLVNSPFSVYDQLIAEYGILGLLAFAVFYIGFFARHFKKLSYGLPLLLLMIMAFFIDYWFEQLSVVVLFELLLLLNIKETSYLKLVDHGNK